jgi:hypothetical protein
VALTSIEKTGMFNHFDLQWQLSWLAARYYQVNDDREEERTPLLPSGVEKRPNVYRRFVQ